MSSSKQIQAAEFTAQPILITGFDGLPDLPALTAEIKGGTLWSIARDINAYPMAAHVIFVQQHAAETFVEAWKEGGFTLGEISLKVDFDANKKPVSISSGMGAEVFARLVTRAMIITIAPGLSEGQEIQPEDILQLNSHLVDPRGGVLRMKKKKSVESTTEGIKRDVIGIEFDSIESCLSARSKIERMDNGKFAGCTVLRYADPCGKITEDTSHLTTPAKPLIELEEGEQSVAVKFGRMPAVSVPGASKSTEKAPVAVPELDLMSFSDDDQDTTGSKGETTTPEIAKPPVAPVEVLEQQLADVRVAEKLTKEAESAQAPVPAPQSSANEAPEPARKPAMLGKSRWAS